MASDIRFWDTKTLRLRASAGNNFAGHFLEALATDEEGQKIEVTFFGEEIGSDILTRAAAAFNAVMAEHDQRVARALADAKRDAAIEAAGAAFAAE